MVSILVANYNNGRFIAETLESAMTQTYPNLEVVVADDGSTDDSVRVIEDFMASHPTARVKFFRNDDNKGCGRVKRQCIEKSEGRYFCFLDPDDTIVPEAVETLMQGFKDHPECGIVYCTHYLCNEKLEPQGVSEYPGTIPEGQSHLTSTGGHISALALCRREIYDKTSGIDASYWVAEDQDLYLKMEEQAPVFFVNRPMYYYRKHDHNTSWSERKTFENYYWKYICEKAAFRRRRKLKLSVANLSRREMNKRSFSFYLRLGKSHWREGCYFLACVTYIKMLFYLGWSKT